MIIDESNIKRDIDKNSLLLWQFENFSHILTLKTAFNEENLPMSVANNESSLFLASLTLSLGSLWVPTPPHKGRHWYGVLAISFTFFSMGSETVAYLQST